MTLEKLFDEKGNVDYKRVNEMYLASYSNGDHRLFRAIYDKTKVLPLDFGQNPVKYYNFLIGEDYKSLREELKLLSDTAEFKYNAGISNFDSKIFMSPLKVGILPEEVYYNPKGYFEKIEKLKEKNPNFSEALNKLQDLYEAYSDQKDIL